jgi:isopropylmalate/homocitrate/citramalate synthase
MRLEVLNQVAEYFRLELGYTVPDKYPLVGTDFNTTKAGIHADGLLKDPEIYNSFNTQKILNRPIVIVVNQASGTAGIAGWINNYYHLSGEQTIDKHDPRIVKIKEWVDDEYVNGRSSNISNEELRFVGNFS